MPGKTKTPTTYTKDIAAYVAATLNISKTDSTLYTNTVIEGIVQSLIDGNNVNLSALGTLKVKETPAVVNKKCRNPFNGEEIIVNKPATKKLKFSPGAAVKKRIN